MSIIGDTRFVERSSFFNGQRLFASDLQDVDDFNRQMRWLHNQSLHQPGIGAGFATVGNKGDREVSIQPGYAIDSAGREIVLTDAVVQAVPPVAGDDFGASGVLRPDGVVSRRPRCRSPRRATASAACPAVRSACARRRCSAGCGWARRPTTCRAIRRCATRCRAARNCGWRARRCSTASSSSRSRWRSGATRVLRPSPTSRAAPRTLDWSGARAARRLGLRAATGRLHRHHVGRLPYHALLLGAGHGQPRVHIRRATARR